MLAGSIDAASILENNQFLELCTEGLSRRNAKGISIFSKPRNYCLRSDIREAYTAPYTFFQQ